MLDPQKNLDIYSNTYLDSWVFGDSVFSFESMGLLFMFLTFSKANSESSHDNRPLKPQKERTAVLKHMSIFQRFRCLFVGSRGCIQYTCIQLFDRFFEGHQSKGGFKNFFCGFAKGFDSDHNFSCSTQNDQHFFPRKMHVFVVIVLVG